MAFVLAANSTSSPSSTALWQPAKPTAPVVEPRSDRLWHSTSFVSKSAQQSAPAVLLWKKARPAAPAKPDALRAPGLWRSSSYAPEGIKRVASDPSRRISISSRSASPAPRGSAHAASASTSAAVASSSAAHAHSHGHTASVSFKRRSWIDSVLPSYVGRSTHYRNSHAVWAESMFQQRRRSVQDGNWVQSLLPSYAKSSGPYRTTHAVWSEKMFVEQGRVVLDGSWVEPVLPSYVKVGSYQTTHASWLKTARANGANISWIEGVLPSYIGTDSSYSTSYSSWIQTARANGASVSWIEGVLPRYVSSGAYETSYSTWVKTARQHGANLSWFEGVVPAYISSGPYRTSRDIWLEQAPLNGADICWVDDVLPAYVSRGRQYKTTHDTWTEEMEQRRQQQQQQQQAARVHLSSPRIITPIPSGACSPTNMSFNAHKPGSFLEHRVSPSHAHPKAVACYPPGSLSAVAKEGPVSLSSMLSPPNAIQNTADDMKALASARFAALQSPCLFHNRFDDAVNLDRVLEEIDEEEEEGYSSSRLLQTVTSVREINKQLQRKPIKRAVRNVMIVTKARDNSLVYLTRDLALWLMSTPRYGHELGVNVYVDAKLKTSKRFDAAGIVAQNPAFGSMLRYWDPDLCWSKPESFDLVLTLGGDGTVLFTSFSLFQRVVPPVLAFGLGSLGFLTPFKFQEYKTSLNKVMGDAGMRVNLRMRFTCTVFRAPQEVMSVKGAKARKALPSPLDTTSMVEGEQFEVLNELVIDRGPSPYVSNLELYADDQPLTVVQADGCIFSTPTGSTAYSLSAGGPLTHPAIPGLVLTPICPHTLSFRPMVLSDTLSLKVCIPRDSRSTAYASFDGKHRVELRRGDCVRVEAGRYPFPTVVGEEGTGGEWFNSVRRALRWNTRGAMQKAFSSGSKKAAAAAAAGGDQAQPSRARFDMSMEQEPEDDMARANVPEADDEDDDEDEEEEEETEWDIDFAPIGKEETTGLSAGVSVVDSGLGLSDAGSQYSPSKKNSVFEPAAAKVPVAKAVEFDDLFGGKMQQVRQGQGQGLGVSGLWAPAFGRA